MLQLKHYHRHSKCGNAIPRAGLAQSAALKQEILHGSDARAIVCPGRGADTAIELIAEYRRQEALSALHDIDGRAVALEKPHAVRGVGAELLRREMAACNHDVYLSAQAKLAELREEALRLITPIAKRLVKSFADELNDVAVEAEGRLNKSGLPVARWRYLAPSH